MSGKGSVPRPLSVDRQTFDSNWDKIFKNEYQDVLSTEDCIVDLFDQFENNTDEPRKSLYISDSVKDVVEK